MYKNTLKLLFCSLVISCSFATVSADSVLTPLKLSEGSFGVGMTIFSDKLYAIDSATNSVVVFPTTLQKIKKGVIKLTHSPSAIVSTKKYVYVASYEDSTVSTISSDNIVVSTTQFPTNLHPLSMSVINEKIYILNDGSNIISVIGPLNKKTNSFITLESGFAPQKSVVFGSKLYVLGVSDTSKIAVIDGSSVSYIKMPTMVQDLVVTNTNLYALAGTSVYVFNAAQKLVTTIPLLSAPQDGLLVKNTIFISLYDSSKVALFDTITNTFKTLDVGNAPTVMALLGKKVYVVNTESSSVSAMDIETNTVETFPVGDFPKDILSFGSNIYVLNFDSSYISVISQNR